MSGSNLMKYPAVIKILPNIVAKRSAGRTPHRIQQPTH
jgi:hypothetical protein